MTSQTQPKMMPAYSYQTLRWIIGILAISLPLVLLGWQIIDCGCVEIRSSISEYYYSVGRNYFVGILFAIGIFLLTYRGYVKMPGDREWFSDDIAGSITCVFLLGVALFPTGDSWVGKVHLACATLAFIMFAYFCLILFVKTGDQTSSLKRRRNAIYRACGWIIILCIVLIAIYLIFLQGEDSIADLDPVFWLEWLAIWAFGISWFVKGKALRKINL